MRCRSTWRAALRAPRPQTRTHYFDLTEDLAATREIRGLAEDAPTVLHAAVRPCARLHRRGRLRLVAGLRHPGAAAHAGGRAAAVSGQCAQVQPHLVRRRADQRVLHPCEAIVDGRRMELPAARGLRNLRAGRRALRGVQHLRRPGHAGGDAGRQGPVSRLQDHPLPGPPRHRQAAAAGLRARRQARGHEGHPADGDSHHRAGRRGRVRHRFRPAQRAAHAGVLRAQGLRAELGGPIDDRDPDHHRERRVRRGRPVRAGHGCRASGFIRQEQVALGDFLDNRFGRAYEAAAVASKEAVRWNCIPKCTDRF